MINLDDDENITIINDLMAKDVRLGLRRLIRYETKTDKFESRILCLCDFKTFLISIKNNKPNKIELSFHLLDIKRLESSSKLQLLISTYDNRDIRLKSFSENDNDLYDNLNEIEQHSNVIDEVISFYCSNLLNVFPSVTIKDVIDIVNIQPEKRLQLIYNEILEFKNLKKKLQICGCYGKAYTMICNMSNFSFYQEVAWDINLIYGQSSLNEFSLNDFDYVNPKDCIPLITALKYNTWFEGFNCDGIKLTNEMQDELVKVLSVPVCKIQNLSLTHASLKHDFFQRLLSAFQATKQSKKNKQENNFTSFKSINLSRNSIEDKGIVLLANLFREFPNLCNLTNLTLSRCSISSKSVNVLFTSVLSLSSTLKSLDISNNNLKEEPVEFYRYLADSNELTELNLSNCEIDVDKLFNVLGRGGCDRNLKKLILNGNCTFSKIHILEFLIKFLKSNKSLNHLELSNCKLTGIILQVILANLKLNPYLANSSNGFYLNLSSNDLGSCLKHFMYEFNAQTCITSLDLSENNLDTDSDLLINQLEQTKIKSLFLSRNFQSSKTKLLGRIIYSLNKWALAKVSHLQNLWLVDCKLRSSLNDFINELGSFSQLRSLDITGNEIGDLGFNYLSKSLQVNRSLQTLQFDKSNVSIQAYVNIIEALKRNFTLKTLQMPMNDICVLYQKSPEKVIDIVKQMSELFSQRNLLLNSQNKCDLDQLFKAKMKLINEPNLAALTHLNTNSSKNNRIEETDELKQGLDSNNSPQYIKEILQTLNETASSYLNNKPIEDEFSKFSSQILEKIDVIAMNLENELHSSLNKKYPKYTASIPYSNSKEKDDSISDIVKLNSLKNNIKDYMNSMIVQIHNDICEMTYKLSTTMAEKVINEAHHNQAVENSTSNENTKTVHSNTFISSTNRGQDTSDTNVSILSKKIVGGIKLPFMSTNNQMNNTTSLNNNSNGESDKFELTNNSKSKRPISSQLQDLLSNGQITNAPETKSKHSKSASSSSNENLVDNGSEDELETRKKLNKTLSNSSSREKTPDSQRDEMKQPVRHFAPISSASNTEFISSPLTSLNRSKSPITDKNQLEDNEDQRSKSIDSSFTPVPAPRKPKTSLNIKSFLRNSLGVGSPQTPSKETQLPAPSTTTPSQVFSPKLGRKANLSTVLETPQPKLDLNIEDLDNQAESNQLKHINKSRPKRANIKKPTVKNPHSNIEVETAHEDLSLVNNNVKINNKFVDSLNSEFESQKHTEQVNNTQNDQIANDLESKKPSPKVLANKSNLFPEQPKVNLNILENVVLRNTAKTKTNQEPVNTLPEDTITNLPSTPIMTTSQTPTTPSAIPNKLGNRFSMFEQTNMAKTAKKIESNQENNEENSSAQESVTISSSNKVTKPLPPIPSKPPRPFFQQTPTTNNYNNSGVKPSGNNKDEVIKNPAIMVKLRPVNGNANKDLNSENNVPASISLTNATSNDNGQPEKRTSVKELAQMLNEESKA